MNPAELIISTLEQLGVSYIFGIPGGALEDINNALYASQKITPIVTKHEQGAAFMADGYARVSGGLGVCCATAGPGATNLLSGVASAYADSVPLLVLTGQVATTLFGKGALQESGPGRVDLAGLYRHVTRYSAMIDDENQAAEQLQIALQEALSGPTGPVHLNLPSNVMKRKIFQGADVKISSLSPPTDSLALQGIANLLNNCSRPVIIAGWGTVLARAAEPLLKLAELTGIPVATSPKAKGIFPESHPLSLGVLGFAGSAAASDYILGSHVDLILAVGTSFNELMTNGWDERLAPSAYLVQIDVDQKMIGRNYHVSHPLLADAREALQGLVDILSCTPATKCHSRAEASQRHKPAAASPAQPTVSGHYSSRQLIRDVQAFFPVDTIFFSDCGNCMAWSIEQLTMELPYSFFVPLGFASMGYAVAASIGGKLAAPDRPVVSLCGDGGFLMNGNELATAVEYDIPVVWVVFNNAMLGMVHHGRKLFRKPIPEGIPSLFKQRTDFARIAEGCGALGVKIERPEQFSRQLVEEILRQQRPTVIDVWIDQQEVPPIHSRIATVDKFFSV